MAIAQETFEHLKTAGLAEIDPEIAELLGREAERQRGQIELIASENFTWPSILEAVGSVPTNKYAEGYPGRRYYGGCEVVDQVEQLAIDRLKPLFGAEHANVQPHSGAQANFAAFRSIADEVGAIFLVDMAHFAGLVAGGVHPSPVPHAQVVTSTTHKTLRGPRAGLILSIAEFAA